MGTAIILYDDEIQGILKGVRFQICRPVKPVPSSNWDSVKKLMTGAYCFYKKSDPDFHGYLKKNLCERGDLLRVKEAWAEGCPSYTPTKGNCADCGECDGTIGKVLYRATYEPGTTSTWWEKELKWDSATHMPLEYCRLFLRVKDVWIEPLSEVSTASMVAEGFITGSGRVSSDRRLEYIKHWDSRYQKKGFGWRVNPFVWRVTFETEEER